MPSVGYLIVLNWFDFLYIHRVPDLSPWYSPQKDVLAYETAFTGYDALVCIRI